MGKIEVVHTQTHPGNTVQIPPGNDLKIAAVRQGAKVHCAPGLRGTAVGDKIRRLIMIGRATVALIHQIAPIQHRAAGQEFTAPSTVGILKSIRIHTGQREPGAKQPLKGNRRRAGVLHLHPALDDIQPRIHPVAQAHLQGIVRVLKRNAQGIVLQPIAGVAQRHLPAAVCKLCLQVTGAVHGGPKGSQLLSVFVQHGMIGVFVSDLRKSIIRRVTLGTPVQMPVIPCLVNAEHIVGILRLQHKNAIFF